MPNVTPNLPIPTTRRTPWIRDQVRRTVATRCTMHGNSSGGSGGRIQLSTYGAGTTNVNNVSVHDLPEACYGLSFSWGNWYQVANKDTGVGNTFTLKASVEYNGVITPLTFNNGSDTTITVGQLCQVWSDPLWDVNFPADATILVHSYVVCAADTEYIPCSHKGGGTYGGSSIARDALEASVAANDKTATLAASIASTTTVFYGPCNITGLFVNQQKPVLGFLGDSIEFAAGDTPSDLGAWKRAINGNNTNTGTFYKANQAYLDMSRGGMTLGATASPDTSVSTTFDFYRKCIMSGLDTVDIVVCNMGTNDWGAGTLQEMKTRLLVVAQKCAQRGLPFYCSTLLPRVQNANLNNPALQVLEDAAKDVLRVGFNQWLRDTSASGAIRQSNGNISGYIETANALECNSSNVLTPDAGFYYAPGGVAQTADGIHPNAAGHALLYVPLVAVLPNLTLPQ